MALVASKRILIPTQAQDYSTDGLEELMDTFEIIKDSENPDLEFLLYQTSSIQGVKLRSND